MDKTKKPKATSKHIVLLLHLKQNAELKRMKKAMKDYSINNGNRKELDKLQLKVDTTQREVLWLEFLKREAHGFVSRLVNKDFITIIEEKFKKNETLDKKIISFTRQMDKSLKNGLSKILKQRKNRHKKVIEMIQDFPVFDEIINYFDKNMGKFNSHTRLINILPKTSSSSAK